MRPKTLGSYENEILKLRPLRFEKNCEKIAKNREKIGLVTSEMRNREKKGNPELRRAAAR